MLSACGDSNSKLPTNIAPSADFSFPNSVKERNSYTLDGTTSSDSDGSIRSYSWILDLGETPDADISLTSHGATATLAIGEIIEDLTVSITLNVEDNNGATDDETFSFNITEVDQPLLPPMPTNPDTGLTGTDSDNDGVRDDIEIAILNLHPLTLNNREVLRKAATVYSNVLVSGASDDDRDDDIASKELAKMTYCFKMHSEMDSKQQRTFIKALTLNTAERLAAWEQFNTRRNGTVQRVVLAEPNECRLPQN